MNATPPFGRDGHRTVGPGGRGWGGERGRSGSEKGGWGSNEGGGEWGGEERYMSIERERERVQMAAETSMNTKKETQHIHNTY